MSFESLKELVTPPEQPAEVGSVEAWLRCEAQLGFKLPSDYREFVFAFGSGLFAGLYRVYNPFAKSEWTALHPSVERTCTHLREFRQSFPQDVPYPIYPEPGGLLPWANDENGNDYYWQTLGEPDTWQVLSFNNRGEGFREHQCSMTAYLTNILTYKCKALASDYPTDRHRTFEVWLD